MTENISYDTLKDLFEKSDISKVTITLWFYDEKKIYDHHIDIDSKEHQSLYETNEFLIDACKNIINEMSLLDGYCVDHGGDIEFLISKNEANKITIRIKLSINSIDEIDVILLSANKSELRDIIDTHNNENAWLNSYSGRLIHVFSKNYCPDFNTAVPLTPALFRADKIFENILDYVETAKNGFSEDSFGRIEVGVKDGLLTDIYVECHGYKVVSDVVEKEYIPDEVVNVITGYSITNQNINMAYKGEMLESIGQYYSQESAIEAIT